MRKRILLIEDRDIVLTGMKESIMRKSKSKVDIDSTKSFYGAKDLLGKNKYDIIVLDLNMAGISGEACFDELPGTTLNGWLFLKEYFFKEGALYKAKCANTKFFIYSGFAKELREMIEKLPRADVQRSWFKKIELIGKVSGEYKTITKRILDC